MPPSTNPTVQAILTVLRETDVWKWLEHQAVLWHAERSGAGVHGHSDFSTPPASIAEAARTGLMTGRLAPSAQGRSLSPGPGNVPPEVASSVLSSLRAGKPVHMAGRRSGHSVRYDSFPSEVAAAVSKATSISRASTASLTNALGGEGGGGSTTITNVFESPKPDLSPPPIQGTRDASPTAPMPSYGGR
jgi:hypothetical protein